MNFVITLLSILVWVGSSYISNHFYPTNSAEDINNFWEIKKVLYSVSIFLIIFSKRFKDTKIARFTNICFLGVVLEDITDRLIFNVNHFEANDIIAIEMTIVSAVFIVYKKELNDFHHKIFNN